MATVMPTDDLVVRLDRMRQDLDQANVPGLLEDAAREIRRLQAEVDRLRDVRTSHRDPEGRIS